MSNYFFKRFDGHVISRQIFEVLQPQIKEITYLGVENGFPKFLLTNDNNVHIIILYMEGKENE